MTEKQNENTCSQTEINSSNSENPPVINDQNINDSKLLTDLFSTIMSQNFESKKSKKRDHNVNDKKDEEEDEEDEEEDEEDEEDEDEEDEEDEDDDHMWDALNKLLDSHLYITKSFLHLVKNN